MDPESFSLTYCSVDDAYAIVNSLGTGALMSKIDLKNAFRLIPVRPNDWNLLGMQWRGKFYIDTFLPFGLRSAPFLFNQLSTAIHWILQHKYSIHHLLHYLDDFFTAGAPASQECSNNLSAMLSLCQRINAPVKPSKVEGPTTLLTFLGILIDTSTMTASITDERKQDLISSLQSLLQHSKCTKRQLLSLIGKLSFACKVIPAGRIFLRRLIDISCSVSRLHHHIKLTKEAHLDMYWWLNFLPQWNGSCCILQTEWTTSPAMDLYTDASGSHGWGAYWSGRWIQAQWPPEHIHKDITWKELYAIAAAVNTWSHLWKRKEVLFHCDNQSVCDIWQKGSTRQPETMALVRMLYFCAAHFDIHVMTTHIAGYCRCPLPFTGGTLQATGPKCSRPTRPHPCMAHPVLDRLLIQYQSLGVAPSTRRTYQAGVRSYLLFCDQFTIPPFPASPLTLRYFCSHIAGHVSHKTIKVYLSGIRLEHLEHGHLDPTDDELLRLLCKGIKRSQGDTSRLRLPITINVLKDLKTQLRNYSSYTLVEKRLLWSAFTLAFYAFLRASEFTASSLLWSDVQSSPTTITIHLRQSKTDPFRRGHSITIQATSTSTCPVHAMNLFSGLTTNRTGPLYCAALTPYHGNS